MPEDGVNRFADRAAGRWRGLSQQDWVVVVQNVRGKTEAVLLYGLIAHCTC